MKDTPVLFWVISGKNAIQGFFMLFLAFTGLSIASGLAGQQSPLYAALPPWVCTAFGASLILGAALNFVSVYWRGRAERGIRLESWSVVWLASVCVAFGGIVSHEPAARAAPGSTSAIVMCLLFAAFLVGRYRQCRKAVREVAAFKSALKGSAGDA